MSGRIGKFTIGMAGAVACVGLLSAGTPAAHGSAAYTQGFENNTNGWSFGTHYTGSGSYGITRYKSGSASPVGTISAASGSYYAVVNNATNNYSNGGYAPTGYGDAGFANFGGSSYPGTFTQSISIYVDASTWTTPANASTAAFWIDESPSSPTGQPNFNMEGDFAFFVPSANSGIEVAANNSLNNLIATITGSGWYTFAETFSQQASGPPESTFNVYNSSGTQLGSYTQSWTGQNNSDLGGPNYLWLTVWQNGFANNSLAIDNVSPFATPVPASLGLVSIGSVVLIGGLALRRPRQFAG